MLAVRTTNDYRDFNAWCDTAAKGESVRVSDAKRPDVVILSANEYQDMQKALRNYKYLDELKESIEQLERGEVVTKSLEELRAMENE